MKDPRDQSIRYVGKYESTYLSARLNAHIYDAKNSKLRSHKINWIRLLINLDLKPQIELIEEGYKTRKELCEAEIFLIQFYKDIGIDLVNGTPGGEGGCAKLFGDLNPMRRPEVREKFKKPLSEEHKKKLSIAKSGKNHPNYGKRGKEVPHFGQKRTEEQNIENSKNHRRKDVCR